MYPQQMLFSGLQAKLHINFSGLQNDEVVKAVIAELKDCNIELTSDPDAPTADVQFDKKGETYQVMINVVDEYDIPLAVSYTHLDVYKRQLQTH